LPIRLKYLAKIKLYKQMKSVVVSLSGGMDSSTLLLRALSEYDNVIAVSFDYGQKHRVELERAQSLVQYLKEQGKQVKYQTIRLEGLTPLLNSALVEGGEEVPEGHYEQENMKATVVPNRNKIFSSIIQAIALSAATQNDSTCDIALGIHAGDHAIYPDCRQEFRDIDHEAFVAGNWDADRVGFFTPYLNTDKFGILQDGEVLCKELGLDFDEVYSRTNTSYKPIQHLVEKKISVLASLSEMQQIPVWFSDYKSASSVERIEAFIKLGRKDPVAYADETGPVTWEVAKTHVEGVLKESLDAAKLSVEQVLSEHKA
jgi:7-cyano-7-deazaguanine synthase